MGFCRVFRVWGVVINGVISRLTILITHIRGLIKTPLINTHEPPRRPDKPIP